MNNTVKKALRYGIFFVFILLLFFGTLSINGNKTDNAVQEKQIATLIEEYNNLAQYVEMLSENSETSDANMLAYLKYELYRLRAQINGISSILANTEDVGKLVKTVVKFESLMGSGSAVAIKCEKTESKYKVYFLTVSHNFDIRNNTAIGDPHALFYRKQNIQREKIHFISRDIERDLALFYILTDKPFECAKLKLEATPTFSSILAVGCPLGAMPFPTQGLLLSKKEEFKNTERWLCTAPTCFGSSGGAVFMASPDKELIGITVAVYVHNKGVFMRYPICHMGLFTPSHIIHDWLKEIKYDHLLK